MRVHVLFVATLLLLPGLPTRRAAAFSSGPGTCTAEASTITGMQTRPRNGPGEGPFQLMIDMGGNSYVPGTVHLITLFADDRSEFTGFLVYGETLLGSRVGAFDKTDDNVGSPVPTCPDASAATASHTNLGPVGVSELSVPWTAPADDIGPIQLRSIVLGGTRRDARSQAFFFPAELTLLPEPGDRIFGNGFEEQPAA